MFNLTRTAFALLTALSLLLPRPAVAFELFGIRLFGDRAPAEETIDPVPYAAALVVLGDDPALIDRIKDASILIDREDEPPSGTVGLLARARDDREGLIAVLYDEGRYGATVAIDIAGRLLDDISVSDSLIRDDRPLPVRITVDPGPLFAFGSVVIAGSDGRLDAAAVAAGVGLAPGLPARASAVVAAEAALVLAWQRLSHPFAAVAERSLVADHARTVLDVRLVVEAGPYARFGRVEVAGSDDVDAGFLAGYAVIPEGAPYHPDLLERARKRLSRLEALGSVIVRPGDRLDPDGTLPILVEVSERKKRTIGAGLTYASTEGAGVEAFWKHRNLFGEAETLRLEGAVERLFLADRIEELDARVAVAFSKPGFLDPFTALDLRTGVIQEDPEPYRRRGVFFDSLLSRELSDHLTVRGGFEFDASRLNDAFGDSNHTIVGLPLIADYDSRDAILDPTAGMLARVVGEPFFDLDGRSPFVRTDGEVRLYHRLLGPRLVVAVRGRAGAIFGAGLADVPAHRRFYAGGGGSVRGYRYLNIGPRLPGFGPTGGLARLEGSAEARIRVAGNWSIVPFVDAGYVTRKPTFEGFDEVRVGVGVGLRYHTAVGPLRLDVAVPLDPHGNDPGFAVYVGIGQAF